jgi:uncharacterized protein (TIGR03067 family)
MPIQPVIKAAIAVLALSVLEPHGTVRAQTPSPLAAAPANELAPLQGAWQGVEVGGEGEVQCRLKIEGSKVRFERADKKEWYVGTITLPAGKNPKQLMANIAECSHPEVVGKVAMAIYKLEGGTLTLAGHPPGDPEAPRSFEGDDTTRTFVLKKSEPEKVKATPISKTDKMPNFARGADPSVEDRFQEADIALAIAHYEKLQSAAFELRLKRELEQSADQRQSEEWAKKESRLRDEAAMLREETIRRATAHRR